MNNETHAKELAYAYAPYLKVDRHKEMANLNELIDDTLTRLEELGNGVNMLQAERERFTSCDFTVARSNLNELCQRIHKLDEMSKKVLEDVESLEQSVDEAEEHLMSTPEGRLKNMLKPLFSMRSDAASTTSMSSTAPYMPSKYFTTSQFFEEKDKDTP